MWDLCVDRFRIGFWPRIEGDPILLQPALLVNPNQLEIVGQASDVRGGVGNNAVAGLDGVIECGKDAPKIVNVANVAAAIVTRRRAGKGYPWGAEVL